MHPLDDLPRFGDLSRRETAPIESMPVDEAVDPGGSLAPVVETPAVVVVASATVIDALTLFGSP